MKRTIAACAGVALGMMAAGAFAATKHRAEKGPPACGALTFRAVASGASDGEQQAGFYRSRYGTLALHADVKGGQPADYFVLADGKRLAAAPAALPDWAVSCAAEKKLPKPAAAGTRPAPVSGSGLRSLMSGTSVWRCSTGSTAPLGITAAPEPINGMAWRRAREAGRVRPFTAIATAQLTCNVAVVSSCG